MRWRRMRKFRASGKAVGNEKNTTPELLNITILLSWLITLRMAKKHQVKISQVVILTPVYQLTSCKVKSCMFVTNKSIVKTFYFHESIIHNNASCGEKVWLLLSSHIKIHKIICLDPFWTVFTCKRCLICAYLSPDSDETTFSTEGSVIMDYRLFWSEAEV